jgi:hypothetical protein
VEIGAELLQGLLELRPVAPSAADGLLEKSSTAVATFTWAALSWPSVLDTRSVAEKQGTFFSLAACLAPCFSFDERFCRGNRFGVFG